MNYAGHDGSVDTFHAQVVDESAAQGSGPPSDSESHQTPKRSSWFTRSYRYLAIIVAKLPNRAECPTIHAAASSTFPSNHLCVMKTISPPFRGDLGVTIGSTILHKRIRCISLELKILQVKPSIIPRLDRSSLKRYAVAVFSPLLAPITGSQSRAIGGAQLMSCGPAPAA